MDLVIRTMQPGDVTHVKEILLEAPEAARWSVEALQGTLANEGTQAFVSEHGGKISGFVVGRKVADEGEILNLAVGQASRRHGEGQALVAKLLEKFRTDGVSRVFLEVRESNTGGIAFYEAMGFRKVGQRPCYYAEPIEAAVVMELGVEKSTVRLI